MRRAGMTLVELLIVLTILVVLTTIAVSMTDSIVDQGRFDATERTLENIRIAIVGSGNPQEPLGGFFADMGTMPAALTDLTTPTIPTNPVAFAAYTTLASVPAGMKPVVWPLSGDTDAIAKLSTVPVTLSAGLRGPYLRLPANSVLADGWGNPFTYPGTTTGEVDVTSTGKPKTEDATTSPFSVPLQIKIPTTNLTSTISVSLVPTQGTTSSTVANPNITVTPSPPNVVLITTVNGVANALSAQALFANNATLTPPTATNGYAFTFPATVVTGGNTISINAIGNRALVAYQTVTTNNTTTTPPTMTTLTSYSSVAYIRATQNVSVPLYLNLQ
jgi:prepilin-type N-terminal cleavage/methylation domain-containing protein